MPSALGMTRPPGHTARRPSSGERSPFRLQAIVRGSLSSESILASSPRRNLSGRVCAGQQPSSIPFKPLRAPSSWLGGNGHPLGRFVWLARGAAVGGSALQEQRLRLARTPMHPLPLPTTPTERAIPRAWGNTDGCHPSQGPSSAPTRSSSSQDGSLGMPSPRDSTMASWHHDITHHLWAATGTRQERSWEHRSPSPRACCTARTATRQLGRSPCPHRTPTPGALRYRALPRHTIHRRYLRRLPLTLQLPPESDEAPLDRKTP